MKSKYRWLKGISKIGHLLDLVAQISGEFERLRCRIIELEERLAGHEGDAIYDEEW